MAKKRAKRKSSSKRPAGKRPRRNNPRKKRVHHRRRNPKTTFVSALGKVAGGAAAMFGSGVVVTLASVKLSQHMATPATATTPAVPANAAWQYVPSIVAALIGAGVATKYPLVGVGVAAGGAAPFVLPVVSRMLAPATPVAGLRAVAMGNAWRSLNASRDLRGVRMGAVSRSLYAT